MDKNDKRLKNLVSNADRTPKQRRENASKAGKASGIARAKRRTMRESLFELLSMPMKKGSLSGPVDSVAGFKDANVSLHTRILVGIAVKAVKGDVRAAEFIRDTIGEAPVQEMKVERSAASELTEEQLRKIANGEV